MIPEPQTAQQLIRVDGAPAKPMVPVLPKTSVVLPAYNEDAGIGLVLERLFAVIDDSYEVIVVDDGSTDATATIAARYPCHLVKHGRNLGKGRAVRTGLTVARGEYIVIVDADHTYPIDMIPRFAHALTTHDFISGSRTMRESIPPTNRVGNWLLRDAIRRFYGSTVDDPLTGLYAVRKSVLQEMKLSSEGFGIEAEIVIKAARMGLRVHNLPVTYHARQGASKLSPLKDGYRILRTIVGFLTLYNPTITFILPGLTLFTLGLAIMILLMRGAVHVGVVTLSFDTIIVAATLALLGSQLTVFGLAANLYACSHWMARPDSVTNLLVHRHARTWLLGLGSASIVVGSGWGIRLLAAWVRSGFGNFTRTGEAIFVSFLVIAGVQTLFSVAFLGLFMGAFSEVNSEASR